jgi:hypothetical protein
VRTLRACVQSFSPDLLRAVETHSASALNATLAKMSSFLVERCRAAVVSAEDNPGVVGAGKLHQRLPHEIVAKLTGAGRLLTAHGHNSYSVQAIEARLGKLAPGYGHRGSQL